MNIPRMWPSKTVAKRNKYTGTLSIDNVEVEYDPAFDKYVEVMRNNPKEKEYDLRIT